MERSHTPRANMPGHIPWMVAGAVGCLPAILALCQLIGRDSTQVDQLQLFFRSDGSISASSQPVEGYDATTPIDPECERYGYEYRVHFLWLPGALCAIFYEDALSEDERALADLGIHSVVRFMATPASQASRHPAADSIRRKIHRTPQEYLRRAQAIQSRLGSSAQPDSPPGRSETLPPEHFQSS